MRLNYLEDNLHKNEILELNEEQKEPIINGFFNLQGVELRMFELNNHFYSSVLRLQFFRRDGNGLGFSLPSSVTTFN